jgi:sodium-dependent dicarboxylate transporter 2/3/5
MKTANRHAWGLRQRVGLYAAPGLALLVYLNPFSSLPPSAHILSAILVWVVVSWATEAIPLAVTSLVGAALCIAMGLGSAKEVLATFAHPIIFLFIGSFFLAEAFVVHGLDRRFAVWLLSRKGLTASPLGMFGAMGFATAVLSMWISNTASVAIMVPIALGLLSTIRGAREEAGSHEPGVLLLLAYGSAAGGIATMIGTPPNIIGVGLLSQQAGISISFFDWMAIGLPLAGALGLGIVAVLFWLHPFPKTFPDLGDHLQHLRRQQEGWTRGQRNTCLALLLAIGCWIGPGVLGIVLGRDSDLVTFLNARLPKEMVPIFAAGLLFVLPVNFKAGEFTLKWTQAANINWGTILLFGGGLTFGHLMVQTHLAEIIGESLVVFFGSNTLWTLTAVAIGTALVITEIASNTASTSMLVPVVISIATAAGISPIPPTLGVCLGASLAFMMPVSTPPNAIVYGTGFVPLPNMLRAGVFLNIIGAALVWLTLRLLCPLMGFA